MIIQGGTGHGYSAGVNSSNQLLALTESWPYTQQRLLAGDGYICATGLVTLTTAGESGLLYLKNNSPDLYLLPIYGTISMGTSTGGATTDVIIRAYLNPGSGTLLSGGTLSAAGNANTGVSNTAPVTVRIGATGSTVVAGLFPALVDVAQTKSTYVSPTFFALAPGSAIAASVQPPASNTSLSLDVEIAFVMVDRTRII